MGKVRKDSIVGFFISYAGIGLGYINKGLLLPLLFLPTEVGLINAVIFLAGFFSQFSNLGTTMVLIRFAPFFQRVSGVVQLFAYTAKILFIGVLGITTLLIIFQGYVLSPFVDKSPLLVKYALWVIPVGVATAYYQLFESYLRTQSKNNFSIFLQELVLRLIILFLIIFYWLELISLSFFISTFFVIQFIPALILFFYAFQKGFIVLKRSEKKISKRFRALIIQYGLFNYLTSFGRSLIIMADTTMLAAMSGLGGLAVYSVMTFMTTALFVPYVSLLRVSIPYVSTYWKEKNMEGMKSLYERVSSIGYFVTFVLFATTWFNIDLLLGILPNDYRSGKYVFLFLMLGKLMDSIGGINGDILLTSKKYRIEIFITVPLIVITFGLNFLFIPEYDVVGASVATAIVYLLYNLSRLIIVYALYKLHPFTMNFLKMLVASIITAITGTFILDGAGPVYDVVLSILIVLICFIVPTFMFNFNPDLTELFKTIRRRIWR